MNYSYVIIDDNPESILKTQSVVARFQNLHFVASANNYDDGLNAILEHQPQIVFLEVDPDNTQTKLSFAIIDELHRYLKQVPKFIITTKGKDFAFDAIKYETLDYLIKPIQINDLRKSVLRFEKTVVEKPIFSIADETYSEIAVPKLPEPDSQILAAVTTTIEAEISEDTIILIDNDLEENPLETLSETIIDDNTETLTEIQENQTTLSRIAFVPQKPLILCVKSYGDYRYIDTNEIQYFQADNNSTDIYLKNGEMITAFKTLKVFEEILPAPFSRIHNSYIVNIDHVSRIHTGNTVCYIRNSTTKLPFSKSYKQNVDDIITTIAAGNYLEI